MRQTRAFTLIELLIVVAIIAILAAIAVPNFLEAQVRSKVSRAKADIRTLATATEAYAVDYNKYPIPSDEEGIQVPMSLATTEVFETRTSVTITTPIAYITSRLNEPFFGGGGEDPQFHYGTRQYLVTLEGDDQEWNEYLEALSIPGASSVGYFYLSHGPDLDHDSPEIAENPLGPSLYDPTNGTVSSGDIVYFGPGTGFQN
ncbi:MAG: ral secretion pathway protein [Candidatus Sumerlaeota bacterium]|nr:ral secretion pathway protein [Candidatus Sumerlaeota bacterium]